MTRTVALGAPAAWQREIYDLVAEAQLAHELAAIELIKAHKPPESGDVGDLQKRVETLEKKLDRVMKHLEPTGGEIR